MEEQRYDEKLRIYFKGKSYDPYEGDNYYRAEGYRLPTIAEEKYMLRGGENTESDSIFKNEAEMGAHAWYEDNSGLRTHPVGLLQAIIIDGKHFYDLYGNVSEWLWDQRDWREDHFDFF